MKIKELLLRTMKPDQTRDHNNIESVVERAGFLKRIDGRACYTTLGLILRKRIEMAVEECLNEFSEVAISGKKDLLSYNQSLHEYNRTFLASYKDIPLKIYTKEEIEFRNNQYESFWKTKSQNVIGLSVLGMEQSSVQELMMSVMKKLGIVCEMDRGGCYYRALDGQDHFCSESEVNEGNLTEAGTLISKDLVTVHTPDIRTIDDLCRFLKVSPEQVIKTMLYTDGSSKYAVLVEGHRDVDMEAVTRVLGIKEDSLRVLSPELVMELTGAEVGFAGPKDLKVDRIIIDSGIRKDRQYIAGANSTDHHLKGLTYGRHFTGDFHSVALREQAFDGWLIGEVRIHPEKIRVQSLKGDFEYHSLSIAYINIDRILLAMAEHYQDDIGSDFPQDISSFQAVVAVVDPRSEKGTEMGEKLYALLKSEGIRVLYDDRKDRIGSKFYDYDLIGIPQRIIVGKDAAFDIKDRNGAITEASLNNIVEIIRSKVIE